MAEHPPSADPEYRKTLAYTEEDDLGNRGPSPIHEVSFGSDMIQIT